jgi:uncharacterized repeat protein (TIGR03803 family)
VHTLNDPSGILFAHFGSAVALDGTRAVISSMVENQAPGKLHRVYLYDFASATPTVPVVTLFNPQPTMAGSNSNDGFGESVAISGSLMAVGAEASDIVTENKGYVWIYGPAPLNTAPVLTLSGANPLAYEARATYTDPGATAMDAEDGAITPIITASTVVPNVSGSYSVTWSAADSIGSVTTQTRTVNVIPNIPPTLSAPMGGFVPLTLWEGKPLPNYAALAIASDNSGSVTVTQSPAPGIVLAPGTHTITLTATDGAGNQTTLSLTITVSAIPATGVFSGDFPLYPKNMWWHNDFTAHPTNGWLYGTCARGGQFDNGMIFRVNPVGDYETLVHFTNNNSRNKGKGPGGRLTLGTDGNFYGTTGEGGANGKGTVFKVTPSGELTTLLESTTFYRGGTARGNSPRGALCPGPDGSLYGTTERGGNSDFGTIFKMDAFGNRTTLVHFTGNSGANRGARPQTGLVLASDGNFYGATFYGGTNDLGTLFRLTPAGVHTTLVDFTGNGATNKGAWCSTRLVQGADGHLYGMGNGGGAGDYGTIFRITLAGELTTLIEFTRVGGSSPGAWPIGALTLGADGTFYGMTNSGGTNDKGTIFKFTTDGVMTVLVNFDLNGSGQNRGGWPWGALAFGPDGALYGMTNYGGLNNFGTIFRMTTGGSITTLADFAGITGTARGSYPVGTLITAPDGFIYGAANSGGTYGMGTLFKMTTGGTITMLVDFKGAGSGIESGGWPFMDDFTLGSDGQLYGMTTVGGRQGGGMVYRIEMPVPDIAVSGNGQNIANNDSTPDSVDHTHFGTVSVPSGTVTRSFSIENTGALSITGFYATSAQGAVITRNGGFVTWTPSPVFVGVDTFTVTLSDGMSTTQGTITLNVTADPSFNPANPPQIIPQPGGAMRLAFFGIPGRVYGIQRSIDLMNWTQIAAPTANAAGAVTIDDPAPPQPSAFYRIIFPAQ